jgi:chromosome condensin MukBEF MukE localization factor
MEFRLDFTYVEFIHFGTILFDAKCKQKLKFSLHLCPLKQLKNVSFLIDFERHLNELITQYQKL